MNDKQSLRLIRKNLIPTPPEFQEIFDRLLTQMPDEKNKIFLSVYDLSKDKARLVSPFVFYRSQNTVFAHIVTARRIFDKSKDYLALIFAHEIAHSKDRFKLFRVIDICLFLMIYILTAVAFFMFGWVGSLSVFCLSQILSLLIRYKICRRKEFRADQLATKLVHAAGFNARDAIFYVTGLFLILEKLRVEEGGLRVDIFENYPRATERRRVMNQTLDEFIF